MRSSTQIEAYGFDPKNVLQYIIFLLVLNRHVFLFLVISPPKKNQRLMLRPALTHTAHWGVTSHGNNLI